MVDPNCFELKLNSLSAGMINARLFDFPVGEFLKPSILPGIFAPKLSQLGEIATRGEVWGRQFDILDGFAPLYRKGRLWRADVFQRGEIFAFGSAETDELRGQLIDQDAKYILSIPRTLAASVSHCTVVTKGKVYDYYRDGVITSGCLVLVRPQTTIYLTPLGSRHQSDLLYPSYRQSDLQRSAYEDIYQVLVSETGLMVYTNLEIKRENRLLEENARLRAELEAIKQSETDEVI